MTKAHGQSRDTAKVLAYQQRHAAQGLCRLCPKRRAANDLRFCRTCRKRERDRDRLRKSDVQESQTREPESDAQGESQTRGGRVRRAAKGQTRARRG